MPQTRGKNTERNSATIVKGRKKLKGQQTKLLLIARAAATIHMAHNGQRERVGEEGKRGRKPKNI